MGSEAFFKNSSINLAKYHSFCPSFTRAASWYCSDGPKTYDLTIDSRENLGSWLGRAIYLSAASGYDKPPVNQVWANGAVLAKNGEKFEDLE